MKNQWIAFLCCIAFLAAACSAEDKKEETADTSTTDSLSEEEAWPTPSPQEDSRPTQVRMDIAMEAMEDRWTAIENAENAKIEQLEVIIKDVPYIEGFKNTTLLDRIDRKKKELQKARFNRETIAQAKVMDAYDKLLEEIEAHLKELSETTVDIERFPTVHKALQDFLQSANQDAILRRDYQEAVQAYNKIIAEEKEELNRLGESYSNLKPKVVFNYSDDIAM
ncbi:MAG: hypothetical protein JJT94_09230 [Bernardetiaceae bacterium]|nr:hypothetical protein [Bernardetiaceae bacterium]